MMIVCENGDIEGKMLTAINDEGRRARRKKSIAGPGLKTSFKIEIY